MIWSRIIFSFRTCVSIGTWIGCEIFFFFISRHNSFEITPNNILPWLIFNTNQNDTIMWWKRMLNMNLIINIKWWLFINHCDPKISIIFNCLNARELMKTSNQTIIRNINPFVTYIEITINYWAQINDQLARVGRIKKIWTRFSVFNEWKKKKNETRN